MSIERTECAELGITPINTGWLPKVLILSTRPAFAGFGRDRLRGFGADRKVAHRKVVALGEDFGDAAAVAHMPIGLVAQQATRPGPSDLGSLLQVELGLGASELLLDDLPKPLPFAPAAGEAPFRRCPECRQMNVTHPGTLDRRRELAFRETG